MISFIPRVGKVKTGQTSGGFTVIIPKKKKNSYSFNRPKYGRPRNRGQLTIPIIPSSTGRSNEKDDLGERPTNERHQAKTDQSVLNH